MGTSNSSFHEKLFEAHEHNFNINEIEKKIEIEDEKKRVCGKLNEPCNWRPSLNNQYVTCLEITIFDCPDHINRNIYYDIARSLNMEVKYVNSDYISEKTMYTFEVCKRKNK